MCFIWQLEFLELLPPGPEGGKKIPFSSRTGSCSTFETAAVAVTSLAVGFGQGTDYPVVIVTANRKCPQQVKPWGFVPVLAGSFLTSARELCPKPGQKIQRGASASFQAGSFV